MLFFFLSLLLPPSSTRTDSRVPYTTLFRSRRSGPGLAGAALRRSGGLRECELRILPPQVGEDGGAAMVRHPDADAARPEIRVRHLWRGRVDAGADAQHGGPDREGNAPVGGGAPDLRGGEPSCNRTGGRRLLGRGRKDAGEGKRVS